MTRRDRTELSRIKSGQGELPGLSVLPAIGSLLMLGAGVAWGIYSLRGKVAGDPARVTAGNFLRAVPIAAALSVPKIK